MGTLADFIQKKGIVAKAEWADRNPSMDNDSGHMTRHFKVTLSYMEGDQRKRLTTYFSQGSAHTKEPTAADVLDCLASDASGVENAGTFEEWASEYGYDEDSRKAERTYKICQKQAAQLRLFLNSDEAYQELLWETERE